MKVLWELVLSWKKNDYNSCFTSKWCKRNPKIVKFQKKKMGPITPNTSQRWKAHYPHNVIGYSYLFSRWNFFSMHHPPLIFLAGGSAHGWRYPLCSFIREKEKKKKTVKSISFSIWYQFLKFKFNFHDNKPQSPSPFVWSYFLLSRYVSSVIGRSRKQNF